MHIIFLSQMLDFFFTDFKMCGNVYGLVSIFVVVVNENVIFETVYSILKVNTHYTHYTEFLYKGEVCQ